MSDENVNPPAASRKSDESTKSPAISHNSIVPSLNYTGFRFYKLDINLMGNI